MAGDQRAIFREIAKLLNRNTLQKLPSHSSLDDLAKSSKFVIAFPKPTSNWEDHHALVLKSVHLVFLTLFLHLMMTLEKF